jgi:alpha-tubulin suppressor-like RCC1 family protein
VAIKNFSQFQTNVLPIPSDYVVGYTVDPNLGTPYETKITIQSLADVLGSYGGGGGGNGGLAFSQQWINAINTLSGNFLQYGASISNLSASSFQNLTAFNNLQGNYLYYTAQISALSSLTVSNQIISAFNTLSENYVGFTQYISGLSGSSTEIASLCNTLNANYGILYSSISGLSGQVANTTLALTANLSSTNITLQGFGYTLQDTVYKNGVVVSTLVNSTLPVKVKSLETQSVNSGGGRNNFFVLSDGTLRCVGVNTFGELGVGDKNILVTSPTIPSYKPQLVPLGPIGSPLKAEANRFVGETISKCYQIGSNVFLVTSYGRVYVSGDNYTQQLAWAGKEYGIPSGNAAHNYSTVFIEIPLSQKTWNNTLSAWLPRDPVIDLAVGTGSTGRNNTYFALTSGGRIWAWGCNQNNQSGLCGNINGTYGQNKFAHSYICDQWATNNSTLTASMWHAMSANYDPIGGTNLIPTILPTLGSTLNNFNGYGKFTGGNLASYITSLGGGYISTSQHNTQTTYAIDVNGAPWSWGNNDRGQLGNGDSAGSGSTYPSVIITWPRTVAPYYIPFYDGSPVKKIVAGSGASTSTANGAAAWLITQNGQVYGAGANGYNSTHDRGYVIGGSVYYYTSETSNGGNIFSTVPGYYINTFTQVVGTSAQFVYDVVAHVDSNYTTAFALCTAGIISGGTPWDGQPYFNLLCWGDNTSGQLGLGSTTTYFGTTSGTSVNQWPWLGGTQTTNLLPQTPILSAGVVKVAIAGNDQYKATLVLDTLGRLWAAGYNGTGLLGNGTTVNSNVFQQVLVNPNLGQVIDIVSTNNGFTSTYVTANFYALLNTGAVIGWGYNHDGTLGVGVDSTPQVSCSAPQLVQIVI